MQNNGAVEDILQASLSEAFSSPPVAPEEPASDRVATSSTDSDVFTSPRPSEADTSGSDAWKAEYEAQVTAWRTQSAEARAKAEKERKRWEDIRAAEPVGSPGHSVTGLHSPAQSQHETEWETVSNANTNPVMVESVVVEPSQPLSPSLSNTGALPTRVSDSSQATGTAQADTMVDLAKNLSDPSHSLPPSVTSSFPSMSLPEHLETPSPPRLPPPQPPVPFNATLAIFDSALSTHTRVKALFTSLAINMFLPFVNGVMLGFGEIFAKNVVLGWFGWKPQGPGSLAAMSGIGAGSTGPWGK